VSVAAQLTALAADPPPVPLDRVFWSEVVGTGLLTLLGCGVVANVVLSRTLGNAGGWLLITFGWGLAVFAGVYGAYRSGAHLNPAVTLGILTSGAAQYAPGVEVSAGSTSVYLAAQLIGAFLGAVLCWLAYRRHFDEHAPARPAADDVDLRDHLLDLRDDVRTLHEDVVRGAPGSIDDPARHPGDRRLQRGTAGGTPAGGSAGSSTGGGTPSGGSAGGGTSAAGTTRTRTTARTDVHERPEDDPTSQGEPTAAPRSAPAGAADKLGVFCTGPAIPAPLWNVVTEVIGTFVLVFVVLLFGSTPSGLGPLAVALLVVGIGASLGGPTGYAINPARDLGPRIAHAVLPIRGKGGSNWGYAWVPIVGPLIGGVLGGLVARLMT